MARTHLTPAERTARDARIRQLAADDLSHRAIARQVGLHHTTVTRILRTTPAPERTTPEQTERTTPAPAPAPERTTPTTSGNTRTPRLLHDLDPRTIQDLNCLMDPRTGALPAPLVRAIRTAADARRTTLRAIAARFGDEERTAETGRAPARAHVAP
ncbi:MULTISPECIES: helix-turn-helix domain-containing protein [Streptomyces rochei group]|uniref:helix-turn-helix domain-containing protein n=1 Tax=Streptomyces rochei group TaxID=2867164 RepID=UPI001875F147|nr:helix-turn-helix domain-containing protein [Streptomyces vinaceusdrappus]GHC44398.1 hypothetical protein GCM10010308_74550 [Streptomyces vinaceusdrappus]